MLAILLALLVAPILALLGILIFFFVDESNEPILVSIAKIYLATVCWAGTLILLVRAF